MEGCVSDIQQIWKAPLGKEWGGRKSISPLLSDYTSILDLPEDCISHIMSLTSPRDVIVLSMFSSRFRSAAKSEVIWEKFLPSDYREIISKSVPPVELSTKKDLFVHFCTTPIILNEEKMSLLLDKKSAKKCYMLGARKLTFSVVGDWGWVYLSQSRFTAAAHIKNVQRLSITGKMETRLLEPNTTYAAYFVFMLDFKQYGFENLPIKTSVRLVDGAEDEVIDRAEDEGDHGAENEGDVRTVLLHVTEQIVPKRSRKQIGGTRHARVLGLPQRDVPNLLSVGQIGPQEGAQVPRGRQDGWMEVEMGEFFIDGENGHAEVEMRFWDCNGVLNWKSGLVIQGIDVRPKQG